MSDVSQSSVPSQKRELNQASELGQYSSASAVDILARLFEDSWEVLAALSPEQYAGDHPGCTGSGPGAHWRHNLDHLWALLRDIDAGSIEYEQRERGTAVESSQQAGAESTEQALVALRQLQQLPLNTPVQACLMMASDQEPMPLASSLGRELAFILHHTIHHNAMIAQLIRQMGGTVAASFGLARQPQLAGFMCTVSLVVQAQDEVLLTHNRDESRQRPAAIKPHQQSAGGHAWFGPQDPQAGGSGWGVSHSGLMVALLNANPHSFVTAPPQAISRGTIVPQLMACADESAAVACLANLPWQRFAPVRCVLIGTSKLWDLCWQAGRFERNNT